jgi:ketosteroid isomerase-like protein
MKKRIWLVCFVLLLGIATSCQKQDGSAVGKAKTGVEADVAAIKTLIDEWIRLYNAEDFQNVMAVFYANNAIVMPPNAPACRTKEAILRMYQTDAELNIEHVDTSVAEDVRVSGNTAVAWGMDTGTTTPRSGGAPVPYSLKWLMGFERQSDGAWKCLYEMWNDNHPVGNLPLETEIRKTGGVSEGLKVH